MPDAKGTVTSALASGNTVALEIIWEGTHTGPLEGPTGTIPASGKRQVTPAAQILIFEGDKIKENHHYFDMMSLLKQIGALQ
jgi:predicted ester cyclase